MSVVISIIVGLLIGGVAVWLAFRRPATAAREAQAHTEANARAVADVTEAEAQAVAVAADVVAVVAAAAPSDETPTTGVAWVADFLAGDR